MYNEKDGTPHHKKCGLPLDCRCVGFPMTSVFPPWPSVRARACVLWRPFPPPIDVFTGSKETDLQPWDDIYQAVPFKSKHENGVRVFLAAKFIDKIICLHYQTGTHVTLALSSPEEWTRGCRILDCCRQCHWCPFSLACQPQFTFGFTRPLSPNCKGEMRPVGTQPPRC